jgi:hypothetical protein
LFDFQVRSITAQLGSFNTVERSFIENKMLSFLQFPSIFIDGLLFFLLFLLKNRNLLFMTAAGVIFRTITSWNMSLPYRLQIASACDACASPG